jgi:methanogenic corrinoid protein MtbC1
MSDLINDFLEALLSLDRLSVKKIFLEQSESFSRIQFIEQVVVVALERLGRRWQEGTVALSQVYMGGRICEKLVDEILPPGAPERTDQPKMAICILADHHKLGKSIVYSVLRASGFELLDYDTMEIPALVERVKEDQIKLLLISVLMLSSALKIRQLREKLTEMALDVKIIVGGAPFRFDAELWHEVGADGMCKTASEAVSVIQEIMGGVV